MYDFEGRTAFVTGGAQGIGLELARALGGRGVKVAIADVDTAALDAARDDLARVTDVVAATLDVRDRNAFAAVADDVEARLGPVSMLFNNAGIAAGVAAREMSYDSWDWVLGVNLGGVVNGVQTFVPRFIERGGGGYIVNTSSGAGLVAAAGYLYATSKFAVVGMSESLHVELAAHGIGVSVLCPGPVATNIVGNTDALRPYGETTSAQLAEKLAAATQDLAAGTPPHVVAEMVMDAIAAGRLHIFSDDIMREPIEQRTQVLLDSLPSVLVANGSVVA